MARFSKPTLAVLAAASTVAVVGAIGGVARAAVHVDPEGPAGAQYSSPLEKARQEASGAEGSAGVPGSPDVAPLFGEGVSGSGQAAGPESGSGDAAQGDPASASSSSQLPLLAGLTLGMVALGLGLGGALSRRPPDAG